MIIKVKSEGCHFTIPIPNRMLLNPLTAKIAAKSIDKYCKHFNLTQEQMKKLFKCICKCKKDFKKLVLVEVLSADGEVVKIKL